MSDNEGHKGKPSVWTDRERLAYLVSLIEHSDTKLNFKTAPLPAGRSVIACERMVGRLKNMLKAELDALKAGLPMPMLVPVPVPVPVSTAGATSFSTAGSTGAAPKRIVTPRKRKGKGGDAGTSGDAREGSPKKRGRSKKIVEPKGDVRVEDEEKKEEKEEEEEVKSEGEVKEV